MKTWYNDATTNFLINRKADEKPPAEPTVTPGPWYVAEKAMWQAQVRFIRTSEDKSGVVGLTNDRDASLVSAAREMFEALEALLEWGREHTSPLQPNSPHELLVAAHHAIAKAKGTTDPSTTKFFNDRHDARVAAGNQSLYSD